jgi:acyl-CoA reductase-like NAD-dependent aldehyde dehydrogenase
MLQRYEDLVSLRRPEEFFIDGRWVMPLGHERLQVVFPATEEVIATPPAASIEDVEVAVRAARAAFDRGPWPSMSHQERGLKLLEVAEKLKARADDFAASWTAEMGAASAMAARGGAAAYAWFSYYGNMILAGERIEVRKQSRDGVGIVVKEAVGVVAAVTPWNSPASLSCKIIAPALAAGCSVILKPAPETPLYAWIIAECIEEAGLPAGVFNFLPADRDVSDALIRHPGVDKVSFIGSTATGSHIAQACAQRLARSSLELGGKSPAVILDDIEPEQVVPKLVPHFTNLSGQMCAGLTRIIVPEKRMNDYADAISDALGKLKVGNPFEADTAFGPVAMKRQYDKVMGYLAKGREEGAQVVAGGGRVPGQERGYYVQATLFKGRNDMTIAREEIFGPVAVLIPHAGDEDAVSIANDTEYGLNGAVYTNDPERAYRTCRRIRAGNMTHNDWVNDIAFAFGGFKKSGIGRDGGPEGLALYQETKVVFMAAPPASVSPIQAN